jgi:alkylation response protein AidB-like acyl-CoA dehydrogenase
MVAVIGLGIARDAIDSFNEIAMAKTPAGATSKLASMPTIQERVGRSEALVGAARAYLFEAASQVTRAGESAGGEIATLARLASATAVQNATEAVRLIYDAAGTNSARQGNRIERCFRDVHMLPKHVAVAAHNFQLAGEWMLGA